MVRRFFSVAVVTGIAVLGIPSMASADIFVKADGVAGDSVVRGHENEIQVSQLSFATTAASTASGGGGGRAAPGAIVISHVVDRSSPLFFNRAVARTVVPSVKIELTRNTGGAVPMVYLRITLKNARVVSVSQSGGGSATEQVGFAFEAAQLQYYPQDKSGAAGPPVNVTWDVAKGLVTP
jgi:type VI secretion system secreted protein Hcp